MHKIIQGDCLELMKEFDDNYFSAIVTDPPYGLKFMNKEWDHAVPLREYWNASFRVLKPGSFLLAFGGTKTFHRLACEIEDAGFELRDTIMWIYGSGFPKSHNHFGLGGCGTALKPAYEPIIMAMKPCDGTFKQNAEKWGLAGINIDACRIQHNEKLSIGSGNFGYEGGYINYNPPEQNPKGRWPANVILDEESGKMLDEQSGVLKSGKPGSRTKEWRGYTRGLGVIDKESGFGDSGGASRFFYCAKSSSSERGANNKHPTVKPLKLMEYLIKLVMTSKDGILLDPFAGSGTTVLASKRLGFDCIGIEKESEYCEIARERVDSILC